MTPARIDFRSVGSKSEAIDHLARGTEVRGIPDSAIAELWADVERLEIDARLTVHRRDWTIIPETDEDAA